MNSLRIIYLDGRKHAIPTWCRAQLQWRIDPGAGKAIRWWWIPATSSTTITGSTMEFRGDDALRIIERMRLIDKGATLEIEYAMTDPKSWEGEWKMTNAGDEWTTRTSRKRRACRISTSTCRAHNRSKTYVRRRKHGGILIASACACGLWFAGSVLCAPLDGRVRSNQKTVTLVGTVKQFKWANPHSWIEMEVPDGKGGSTDWNVGDDVARPSSIRAGWKSSVMKPGDKVTIVPARWTAARSGGQFVSVTFADGTTMTERGQPAAAPSETVRSVGQKQ